MTQDEISMIREMVARLDRKLDKILERLNSQNLF
jgi:hypothetical protein